MFSYLNKIGNILDEIDGSKEGTSEEPLSSEVAQADASAQPRGAWGAVASGMAAAKAREAFTSLMTEEEEDVLQDADPAADATAEAHEAEVAEVVDPASEGGHGLHVLLPAVLTLQHGMWQIVLALCVLQGAGQDLYENTGLLAEYFAPFDLADSCDAVNGSTQVLRTRLANIQRRILRIDFGSRDAFDIDRCAYEMDQTFFFCWGEKVELHLQGAGFLMEDL
eukprot:symbB.v1.2.004242.t1/scaffold221.1/size262466/26